MLDFVWSFFHLLQLCLSLATLCCFFLVHHNYGLTPGHSLSVTNTIEAIPKACKSIKEFFSFFFLCLLCSVRPVCYALGGTLGASSTRLFATAPERGTEHAAETLKHIAPPLDAVASGANATVEAVEKSSFWDFMGTPVDGVISAMEFLHTQTGLPWWATICSATLVVRLCVFPVGLFQMRNVANLAKIKPEMERLTNRMKDMAAKGDIEVAQKYRKELKDLLQRNNANPMKSMVTMFVQAPIFMSFFFGLRKMASESPGFAEGGMLWFANLASPDPYFILPILSAGIMYANVHFGSEVKRSVGSISLNDG